MYLIFVGMNEKLLEHKIVNKDVEVVRMLSNGKTVKEIAIETSANEKTIEMRIYRLRKNLDLKSAAHLTAFFVRNKIIE